jgi:hypothetical protein
MSLLLPKVRNIRKDYLLANICIFLLTQFNQCNKYFISFYRTTIATAWTVGGGGAIWR